MRSKIPGSGNLCNKNAPEIFAWRGKDGVIPCWQVRDDRSNDKRRRSRIHGKHSKKHSKNHGTHSKVHEKHSKNHENNSKIHGKHWKKKNKKTST